MCKRSVDQNETVLGMSHLVSAWMMRSRLRSMSWYCRLAGIEPWELFRVDNSGCSGMPLGVPEKDAASNPAAQSLTVMQPA